MINEICNEGGHSPPYICTETAWRELLVAARPSQSLTDWLGHPILLWHDIDSETEHYGYVKACLHM